MEQGMRLHLRVERAGGPWWLFFPWLWRVGCDCRGTSPLGQERGAEHDRAFPMRCRGRLGVHALVPGQGLVSCSVTPSSQRLVWATSSQAGSQAPVRSREPRSRVRAGQQREARGRPGPLPAPATPARAQTGSRQPLPPGGRGRGGAPRRAGWQLRASSPSRLCNSRFWPDEGPQGKGGNEETETLSCQGTRVGGGRLPQQALSQTRLLSTSPVPALSLCWPPQMLMG